MKKIWTTGILIGVLILLGMSTVVNAAGPRNGQGSMENQEELLIEKPNDATKPYLGDQPRIKFKGIWGYDGSNETVGYVGGVIVKHERVATLKGLWNTTDNCTNGKVVGILRNGYFNGKIITQNQTEYRIVGIYRYDTENNLLHLRWMTVQHTGWAHCRIIVK